ncbi:MAG: hypothetical protein KI785_03120 [Devosiaceae bacterium]|nr:hypothetical protein [Devosiaceae bacterium MH13]
MLGYGLQIKPNGAPSSGSGNAAALVLDFTSGVAPAGLVSTRSGSKWGQQLDGTVIEFAANEPVLTDAGLQATQSASRDSHEPGVGQSVSGGINAGLQGKRGLQHQRVTANGATWHRTETNAVSVSGPITKHWRASIDPLTAPNPQLVFSITRSGSGTTFITPTNGTDWSAGTVLTSNGQSIRIDSVTTPASGVIELVGTADLDATAISIKLGARPAVDGESVDAALQITDGFADWILGGGSSTASVAADDARALIGAGTFDFELVFADSSSTTITGQVVSASGWAVPNSYTQAITRLTATAA